MNAEGIKERVKTTTNSKGQKVKTVQKIRVQEIKKRIPIGVLERKNLPKFGGATRDIDCVSKEVAIMEYPIEEEAAEEPEAPRFVPVAPPTFRPEIKETPKTEEVVEKQIEFKQRPGFEEATIRVSNLSKSVNEQILRDVFQPYGNITKLSLPRTQTATGAKEVRGFAYITYDSKVSAETAMAALEGKGLDHLILKFEWAKPPKEGGGDREFAPRENRFMSGYGKQLAQDTKEKAVFTSHGNN